MIPHSIRLRHPWDELPGGSPETVIYRRRFQRPTNLDASECVTLEIDRAICSGTVALNGIALGNLQAGEYFTAEVTSLLQSQNELSIEIDPKTRLGTRPKRKPSTSSIRTNRQAARLATCGW